MLAYSRLQVIAFLNLNKFITQHQSEIELPLSQLHCCLWLIFPYPLLELCYCCPESVSLFSPLSSTCLGLLELTVKPRQLGLVTFLGRREPYLKVASRNLGWSNNLGKQNWCGLKYLTIKYIVQAIAVVKSLDTNILWKVGHLPTSNPNTPLLDLQRRQLTRAISASLLSC